MTEQNKDIPKTLVEAARRLRVFPSTITARLRRGWSRERAFTEPINSTSRDTVAAKARAAGLHPSTVRTRLKRGWDLERALSEPATPNPGTRIMREMTIARRKTSHTAQEMNQTENSSDEGSTEGPGQGQDSSIRTDT